jgi:hypothetical protein
VEFVNQLQGVIHDAVFGGYVSVDVDVVAEISLGRGKERGKPKRLESPSVNVIQFLENIF